MFRRKFLFCFSLLGLTLGSLVGCSCEPEDVIEDDNDDDNDNQPDNDNVPFSGELMKGPQLEEGEYGIAIRYQREDLNSYSDWRLWIWENNGAEGQEYTFNEELDDFGAVCFLPLSTWSDQVLENGLGIITKKAGTWDGQSKDMILNFSDFEPDEDRYYNVFIHEGEDTLFNNPDFKFLDEIKSAAFLSENRIRIEATNTISNVKIYKDDTLICDENGEGKNYYNYDFSDTEKPDVKANYEVEITFEESGETLKATISKRGLYDSEAFNEEYYFDGELGAIYSKEETVFRVWSPLSEKIELRIYENGTPTSINPEIGSDVYTSYEMKLGEKGVFETTIQGNLEGKYYTYVVSNSKYENKEIVDPYAKSTGINGLRGMIVDFSKTNPANWDEVEMIPYKRTELVIYETHVADVTSSETWGGNIENSKKYGGLIEKGTTFEKDGKTVSTGFDHIKNLGVNAIQLLPIFDQANDELKTTDDAFNWGYNPLNYNSLDGIYSSNPYDGYTKIREFKEIVKAFNEAGINIIMDVVYNHVNAAEGSNFDVLMPEYYFRYNSDGTYSNGSGCGNETASENKMMQKFMIDSTEFWASEYKLGGFRFDLMGLHDIKTMNTLVANLKTNYNENVFVHGEPWTAGGTILSSLEQTAQSNIASYEGFGAFNDKIRDSLIKGGLSAAGDKGWATNLTSTSSADYSEVKNGILGKTGSYTNDPLKATNYVTCHDNYTLYDRIVAAYKDADGSTSNVPNDLEISEMATLANSIVLTSQGTSFILAGEEMLRTKEGDSNSYASGYKVNEIDYSRLIDFDELASSYKKMIEFKTSFGGLQFDNAESIKTNVSFNSEDNKGIIDYSISYENDEYRIIHVAPSIDTAEIDLEGQYDIVLETKKSDLKSNKLSLSGSTSIVLKRNANL